MLNFLAGDCHDLAGNKDHCVTGAIYNYTKQLMEFNHSGYSAVECTKCILSCFDVNNWSQNFLVCFRTKANNSFW